jgi:[ribosomal protein S18]-alanine N-acetyltransferase
VVGDRGAGAGVRIVHLAAFDDIRVRALTLADATRIAGWRYGGPWDVYDLNGQLPDIADHFAVIAGAELVGFYCVDVAARVPGLAADPAVVDVGLGMAPALVGRGHGSDFGRAVVEHVTGCHPARELRAVVQRWNERSLRFARRLGFADADELTVIQNGRNVTYVVLRRPADA